MIGPFSSEVKIRVPKITYLRADTCNEVLLRGCRSTRGISRLKTFAQRRCAGGRQAPALRALSKLQRQIDTEYEAWSVSSERYLTQILRNDVMSESARKNITDIEVQHFSRRRWGRSLFARSWTDFESGCFQAFRTELHFFAGLHFTVLIESSTALRSTFSRLRYFNCMAMEPGNI